MLIVGGAPVETVTVNRQEPDWSTVADTAVFELGGFPLVVDLGLEESVIIERQSSVTLGEVIGTVVRASDVLLRGQFESVEVTALAADGQTARWALRFSTMFFTDVVVLVVLLEDVGCRFIENLEILYCESHMHEDRDELEAGVAACLSRGGALIAGLNADGLAQLDDEEYERLGSLLYGDPIPEVVRRAGT